MFEGHLPETTSIRATLWGGITLCVLGMAVNDSGISIPAVMFTLFLPTVLYEALTPFDLGEVRATGDPDPDVDPDPDRSEREREAAAAERVGASA